MDSLKQRLRGLPKIDALVAEAARAAPGRPIWALTRAAREVVDDSRRAILTGGQAEASVASVLSRSEELVRVQLRPVVNATGVILHTNLGRAPLAAAALEALPRAAGYCNLEMDLERGERGSRHQHLADVLRDVCGAGDACVVNNNAAAVLLTLAAIAGGGEVVISRGELIEIGGSFRIPEVMEISRARLVEVGTTNKTRAADYQRAIGESTSALLKVHRANFEMVGFTEEVTIAELAAMGRERGIVTVMDLGSGALMSAGERAALGLGNEPGVAETLAAGIDLVTFSGDKLLGGPQAGIVAGRADLVERVRRHPLMRALRPDKLTIAALAATLELYRSGEHRRIPAVAMMALSPSELRERAEAVIAAAGDDARRRLSLELVRSESAVGGGARPTAAIESVAISVCEQRGRSADELAAALRGGDPPVVGRVKDQRLLLDLRAVWEGELPRLADVLRMLAEEPS